MSDSSMIAALLAALSFSLESEGDAAPVPMQADGNLERLREVESSRLRRMRAPALRAAA